jgi:hypothetical protein
MEQPATIERLASLPQERARLLERISQEIEQAIAKAEPAALPRAAYLAICTGVAEDLRRTNPDQWRKAIAALQAQTKVMHVLFYESPIPAGEELRAKAVAAGLVKPERRIQLWTSE